MNAAATIAVKKRDPAAILGKDMADQMMKDAAEVAR